LLVCAQCGYASHGCTNDERNAYYRCSGSMSLPRFGGKRWCWNKELRIDQTDAAVWREVCQLLEEPERLEQEYRQRLQPQQKPKEQDGLDAQMGKLRRGIARLIDSYADGLIDKQEFEPRVTRLRERLQHLEEQLQHLQEEAEKECELRLILGRLETFAAKVKDGLQNADFQTRREIIRALVKRVEIDEQQIRVVFRVSPTSPAPASDGASPNLQHWGRRVHACAFERQMLYMETAQPFIECEQIRCHRRKRPDELLDRSGCLRQQNTDDNHLFMHVQTCTPRVNDLHESLLLSFPIT
jgi:site-specific DNA recombinase